MGFFHRPSVAEMEAGRPKVARTALKRARKFSRLGDAEEAYYRRGRSWRDIAHREIAKLARSGMPVEEIVGQLRDPEYDNDRVTAVICTTKVDFSASES